MIRRYVLETQGRVFATYAEAIEVAMGRFAGSPQVPSIGYTRVAAAKPWPARYRERGDADWRAIAVTP